MPAGPSTEGGSRRGLAGLASWRSTDSMKNCFNETPVSLARRRACSRRRSGSSIVVRIWHQYGICGARMSRRRWENPGKTSTHALSKFRRLLLFVGSGAVEAGCKAIAGGPSVAPMRSWRCACCQLNGRMPICVTLKIIWRRTLHDIWRPHHGYKPVAETCRHGMEVSQYRFAMNTMNTLLYNLFTS